VCTLSPVRPFKTSRHFDRGSPRTTTAQPNAKLCLLNNIYFSCFLLAHGSPTLLWQGGETVNVGWLKGRTLKNKNKWYIEPLKLLSNFYSIYIILKYGRRHNTTWRAAGWRPKSYHKAAQATFAFRTWI
jgi:hypothetical protein